EVRQPAAGGLGQEVERAGAGQVEEAPQERGDDRWHGVGQEARDPCQTPQPCATRVQQECEQQGEPEHGRHQNQTVDEGAQGAGEELAVGEHGRVVAQPCPHLAAASLAQAEADDLLTPEADVDGIEDGDRQEGEEADRGRGDEDVPEAVGAPTQPRAGGGRGSAHARSYPWFSRSATVPSCTVVTASSKAAAVAVRVAIPKASLNSE